MKVTAFLIKYGEIAIKGKNRYMFEDALMKQIRHAMAPVGDFKVRKESGRMFVEAQDEFDYDEAVEALQRVFGIVGICPMVIEENKDMEHLTETVIKFIDEQYPVKDFTFKVHARRGDKQFPLDSMAINMEIGGQLLDAFEGNQSRCAPSTGYGKYRGEKIYLYLFSGDQRTRWNASWN